MFLILITLIIIPLISSQAFPNINVSNSVNFETPEVVIPPSAINDSIFWNRTAGLLFPRFAGDDITTTGLGTFGNLDVDTLNFNGNVISDSTGTIRTTSSFELLGENQLGDLSSENHGINIKPTAYRMLNAEFVVSDADTDGYFIFGKFLHSGAETGIVDTFARGYYLDFDILGTDTGTTEGKISRGLDIDLDDGMTIQSLAIHRSYGVYSDTNFYGINTNNFILEMYGGYFESGGSLGTTGETAHYGLRTRTTGTADNNYGIWLDVSGATNNKGIVLDNDGDGGGIFFGASQDASIRYSGSNLEIRPRIVGSGDVEVVSGNIRIKSSTAGLILRSGGANNDRYGLKYGLAGITGGSDLLALTNREVNGELGLMADSGLGGSGGETEIIRIEANPNLVTINGTINLVMNTTALTCSGSINNGSIMYNGVKQQGCNGTNWFDLY